MGGGYRIPCCEVIDAGDLERLLAGCECGGFYPSPSREGEGLDVSVLWGGPRSASLEVTFQNEEMMW